MRVLLTYVSSVNGKITNGYDPDVTKWSSKEDKEQFHKIRDDADVIIRSSRTYELVKGMSKPEGQLMVVMTRSPEKYKVESSDDTVEFTDKEPREVVAELEKRGYKSILVAAGGTLTSQFFRYGLVDEFYLTIEPKIFGTGVNMIGELDFTTEMELMSADRLNGQGTMLLKYRVRK